MATTINGSNRSLPPPAAQNSQRTQQQQRTAQGQGAQSSDKYNWKADWANVPQLRGELRRNGATWCGPAVGTTLARMIGSHKDTRNHDLFHQLREKHTTDEGTTPEKMIGMIRDVGGRVDGQIVAGGFKDSELNDMFKRDAKVVAQIGVRDPKSGDVGSHWVIVSERSADGSFTVKDPLRGELKMNARQLRDAVNLAPGLGGMLIPVAPNQGGTRSPTGHSPIDSFVQAARSRSTSGGSGQGIPAGASSQQLANQVARQLSSSNRQTKLAGQARLDALERNGSSVAQRAYDLIMRMFAKEPGGGLKNGYNGYGD
jgi:hypothetical protein